MSYTTPSPSNSIDSDVEYLPSSLPPATTCQINRFVELTSLSPKQARKHLHQYRNFVTGEILFDDAVTSWLKRHNHEHDKEYVYGEDGCFCLQNAAELVLGEIIRDVREDIGRDQANVEFLWSEVERKIGEMMMRYGKRTGTDSTVPWIVFERANEKVDEILRGMRGQTPSLQEETFIRNRPERRRPVRS